MTRKSFIIYMIAVAMLMLSVVWIGKSIRAYDWEKATVTEIENGICYAELADGNVYGFFIDEKSELKIGDEITVRMKNGNEITDAIKL